ncbi:MAG: hypothetical protein L6Q57_05960 [Alphaproteobacteria bacterium]|nr:hypothetical protein [Alphaproteobacteria bacterium]
MSQEQVVTVVAPVPISADVHAPVINLWKPPEEEQSAPLWLITFADIMALSLTFFVMLYAMSNPKQDKFDDMSRALQTGLSEQSGQRNASGAQDAIQLMAADYGSALNLRYLMTMLEESRARDTRLASVVPRLTDQGLVLSLPLETLFASQGQEISIEGQKVLYALVEQLARVHNRVEIISTDAEREQAYKQSIELAAALSKLGYDKEPILRAIVDPEKSTLEIWIMPDDGKLRGFLRLGS